MLANMKLSLTLERKQNFNLMFTLDLFSQTFQKKVLMPPPFLGHSSKDKAAATLHLQKSLKASII